MILKTLFYNTAPPSGDAIQPVRPRKSRASESLRLPKAAIQTYETICHNERSIASYCLGKSARSGCPAYQ